MELYNRGGAGDSPGAYPNMSRMSIGEVMRNQALPTNHPDYLFAAGGLQITEDALKEAMRYTRLSPNLPYTPQVQQHLVIFGLLANPNKRPQLASFLLGKSNDIVSAHNDLAWNIRLWLCLVQHVVITIMIALVTKLKFLIKKLSTMHFINYVNMSWLTTEEV